MTMLVLQIIVILLKDVYMIAYVVMMTMIVPEIGAIKKQVANTKLFLVMMKTLALMTDVIPTVVVGIRKLTAMIRMPVLGMIAINILDVLIQM
jgi:hypothetical protein